MRDLNGRRGARGAATPEIKLCNCAECGCELLGESMFPWVLERPDRERAELPGVVYCRVKGRPYCKACAERPAPRPFSSWGGPHDGEPSPWLENAVRELEDTR